MSTTTQALSLIGAIVGAFFTAGTSLAAYGAMMGAVVGGAIGASLEPDTRMHGPRMDDRRVQVSTYGAPIPYLFGTTRVAGNVIWAADLEEVAHENEQGGKGGPSHTTTTYTYFGTFAVLLGYGPVRGVRRVWADSKLIFDGTASSAPPPDFGMRLYSGSEDQLPDPTMEAALGVGNVPAYRGFGYIVFNRLPLEKFGNRLPSITVELTAEGEWESTKTNIGTASALPFAATVQRLDGYVIGVSEPAAGTTRLSIIDPATGLVVTTADHAVDLNWSQVFLYTGSMFYVPPINEVWLAQGAGNFERYSAETLARLGTVTLNLPWNESVGAYEPSQRRIVVHRASSQVGSTTSSVIRLDGTEEYGITYPYGDDPVFNYGSEGIFYGGQIITGGNAVFLVCGGFFEFGVFSVGAGKVGTPLVVAHPTPGSSNAGAWDGLHQRYVVAGTSGTDGAVWTVTDADPPVITMHTPTGMFGHASPRQVQYVAGLDAIVVWSSVVGIIIMTVLDASTFEVLHVNTSLGTSGITQAFPSPDDPGRVFVQGNYQPYDVQIFGTTVGAAVRRLGMESGLESADIDVTELSMRLRGLIVAQAGPAVSAIEQLARVFQFEGVEEDDQLYFRRRGSATVATISADECAAGIDKATDSGIVITRMQEIELPRRLSVSAPDPATDHQPGTQYAERRAIQSGQEEALSTAVVLTATESKRLADALIFDRWSGRERLTWATHCRYVALSPSDPIILDGRRVRILTRTQDGGVIKWEGVSDDDQVVMQVSSGVQGSFPGQVPSVQVPTLMTILDMALLADAQDDAGAYVAAWGVAPYWRGALIYSSADGGASWTRVTTMPRPGSAVGTTTTALGDWTGGNVFDEANSVNLSLSNGTMSSDTRAGVLAGNNAIAIEGSDGWEVLQYREAVLEANGSYTLRGLLRGRRGTSFATGGHAAGNRAVLLSTTSLRDLAITNSQIGMSLLYKAVSIGDTLSSTASTSATINAERLKPWSPVDFRALRDVATGDITMTWKRRTRLACRFVGTGGINVPLGEASEAYVVRILDPGSPSTVVRTINVTGPATAAYSAAEQVGDFGALQSTIYVRVGQVSATVGLGHELAAAA